MDEDEFQPGDIVVDPTRYMVTGKDARGNIVVDGGRQMRDIFPPGVLHLESRPVRPEGDEWIGVVAARDFSQLGRHERYLIVDRIAVDGESWLVARFIPTELPLGSPQLFSEEMEGIWVAADQSLPAAPEPKEDQA